MADCPSAARSTTARADRQRPRINPDRSAVCRTRSTHIQTRPSLFFVYSTAWNCSLILFSDTGHLGYALKRGYTLAVVRWSPDIPRIWIVEDFME